MYYTDRKEIDLMPKTLEYGDGRERDIQAHSNSLIIVLDRLHNLL